MYTFIPYKSFGQLSDISNKDFTSLKTFDSELSYIEVWFNYQSSKPLEMENKTNITFSKPLGIENKINITSAII